MPLPDATQWELVEQVADVGYVVFNHLRWLAAQQPLVFQDDTGARVLSLLKDNQAEPPPARQGIYTTVLRCVGAQRICLFFSDRQHAGENLADLLALRAPALAPMLWMSDALAANTPKCQGARVVDLNCLVHARRQFSTALPPSPATGCSSTGRRSSTTMPPSPRHSSTGFCITPRRS